MLLICWLLVILRHFFCPTNTPTKNKMPSKWEVYHNDATDAGVFTAYPDGRPGLSFSAFSAFDAVSVGCSSLRDAGPSSSSDATSKRSDRTLLDVGNKRIKSSDEDDDLFEDARTGDDDDDFDVDASVAFLEETKEESLRSTNSTNATAPPTNERTRIVTPPTENSTEDAEEVTTTTRTSVSHVSVRSPKTYRMDENGSWVQSILTHYMDPISKEILARAVNHVTHILPDQPFPYTNEDGIDNVTSITHLKEEGHLPTLIDAFLPTLMALIFTANFGWHSFTTQVLEDLVAASKTAYSGYESTVGVCYMKVYHRTKQWWMGKIRRCLQYCTNRFVKSWAENVRESLTNLDDDAYFTAIYIGESMLTFAQRMAAHYPIHFYEWFGPWT